jgi:Alternative complex III, ActD subunit
MTAKSTLFGLLAEFDKPHDLVECVHQARKRGYRKMDGFSPFPVEHLAEELGSPGTKMPAIALAGGLTGGIGGYVMQYFSAVADYPINVGGRPFNSWPSFVIVTFELTILFAGLFTVFGMLALNGLPRPHHPLFGVPQFSLATDDRFFFCIEAADPEFDEEKTRAFLLEMQPLGVYPVHDT